MFHNGQVLIAGANELVALSPPDGRTIHSYPYTGGELKIDNGVAARGTKRIAMVIDDYLANDYTGTASLICFNSGETEPEWTLPLGGAGFGEVLLDESHGYFGTRDGMFSAVDLATGQFAWQLDCADFFTDRQHVWLDGTPLDNGDSVIFTGSHRSLESQSIMACVEKGSGKVRWSLANPTAFSHANGLAGGSLVAVTLDHKRIRIDRASGKVNFIGMLPVANPWHRESYSVAIDDGFVFVVGAANQVWRFDLARLK